ncbi:outer membrane protein assembly factor BamB family protein [Verrucomicrobiota bacterium sgz303538]
MKLPLVSVVTLAISVSISSAENWPAWRGPKGDGVTSETNLPLHWSATENVKWKIDLPERGNSTPIVWENRVFLTQAQGQRRTVMCVDRKDGKLLWQEGPTWSEPERTHNTNPTCSSSPVTDGERVIAWFGSAGIWCWDLNGKELWHVDLGKQDHEWGYGSSPVLHGDLCILNFGPGPRSFLVALNKKTGQEIWRKDVPPATVPEGPGAPQGYSGAWSTPVIVNTGSRTELIASMPGAVRSFDPQTGKELWHSDGLNPLSYSDPLVADDVIVGMGGFGGFALGVKTGGSGDVTATHRLWQEKRSAQRLGSGVVKDGLIYMVNEPGIIQCIEPKTGKVRWQERPQVPGGRASTWSSLLLSGDRLYLETQASDTLILKAAPTFEQLAVNTLGDGLSNSSVVASNGELFIRTHKHLWCIGEGK